MRSRLMLVLLFMWVADSKARVVNSFQNCSQFFYRGILPRGFEFSKLFSKLQHREAYEYICQQHEGQDYFATMYMPKYRIPLFSAYRLDNFNCTNTTQSSRKSVWFIEPQLSDRGSPPNMSSEGWLREFGKEVQAVNVDYKYSGYDRGHLNPSFYQCDNARTATFTLTNAVPQDPCFNQQKWKAMEEISKQIMQENCAFPGAQRFFVTGVIPSNTHIPFLPFDFTRHRRVNVPYGMWTAACCDSSNAGVETESFSFSYFGVNGQDFDMTALSINGLLKELYSAGFSVQIFTENCFPESPSSKTALNVLRTAASQLNWHSTISKNIRKHYSIW